MNIQEFIKKQPPGRLITMGFALVILIGTLLLLLPFSIKSGVTVTPLNALFTATSAVCVTGLVVVDTADTFTAFGQTVIGILIQIGGLGVASAGLGLMIAAGKKVSIKSRVLAKEALNVDSYKGIVRMVEAVLLITLVVETAGALLSFPVFLKDYSPLHALGISIFHSVASFNNAGFDILGNMTNLIPYRDNVALNLITSVLVIVGGIGFPVILDLGKQRNFRRLTLHTKVVLVTTSILLAGGTLLLRLTEPISWMAAFFHSMSARTAGIFHLFLGKLQQWGTVRNLCPHVHRSIFRFHRRRCEDQYDVCIAAVGAERIFQASGRRIPEKYSEGKCIQSVHDRDLFSPDGLRGNLPDVCGGAGAYLHAALF